MDVRRMAARLGIRLIPLDWKLSILLVWILLLGTISFLRWVGRVSWTLAVLQWRLIILLVWIPLRWTSSSLRWLVRRPRAG